MKKIVWLFLLLPGILAADKVYKWLDNNGVIHYSVEPPVITRPGDIKMDAGEILFYEPQVSPEYDKTSYVINAADEPEPSAYCQKIRQNLVTLYKNDRVRIKQPDGTYHELDNHQKKAKIDEISALLKQHCH
ncbi:DUF4124 domain-containing protein [Endozoicomonas sp. Mp262]|uniref:DUF4124 domain-containing protein n=1 Tax=Endozoicomonas sp. Mp262 TaxID=2919499 RepID=UPI0021D952D1